MKWKHVKLGSTALNGACQLKKSLTAFNVRTWLCSWPIKKKCIQLLTVCFKLRHNYLRERIIFVSNVFLFLQAQRIKKFFIFLCFSLSCIVNVSVRNGLLLICKCFGTKMETPLLAHLFTILRSNKNLNLHDTDNISDFLVLREAPSTHKV